MAEPEVIMFDTEEEARKYSLRIVPESEELLSPINQKALTYAETINSLTPIVDQEQYLYVGMLWKNGRELLKEIDDGYKDLVRAADKLHKDLVAKRAKYYNPTEAGVRAAKSLMSNYEQEQERIRQEKQRKLEEEARKAEEDRRLEEAIEAEKSGDEELAEALIQEPVNAPPVVLPKETPKIKGGPSFRTIWDFTITDAKLIPREYLRPDEVKIRGVVNSLKGQVNIPGVKPFSRRV